MVEQQRDEDDDFLEEQTADVPRRRRARKQLESPPTFSTVMAIIDLIFSVIRIPLLFVSLLGLVAIFQDPNLRHLAIPSSAAAVAELVMAICGLAAGIGILMKKPWAVLPGWIAVGMAVLSIGLNVLTTLQNLERALAAFQGPQAEAARVGAFVGLAGTVLIRLVLLGCYALALSMYSKWITDRQNLFATDEMTV